MPVTDPDYNLCAGLRNHSSEKHCRKQKDEEASEACHKFSSGTSSFYVT
jgi:hypothetical protein